MSKKKKILIIIPILLLVIILMSMNISSLKKLFADINSLSTGTTTFKDWSESPTTLDSKYSNSTIFLTKDSSFEVYRNKDGEVKKYMCDYSKFNGSDTYTTEAEEYMKNSNYKFLIQWSKIDVTENGDTYTFCFPRVEIDLLDGETYQNLDNDVELTEGFSILAKNSAINANGNYIDAVLTTKNLVFWNNKELDAKYVYKSRITTRSLEGITSGQYSRLDSEGSSQVPVVLGIPIEFNLDHMIGQVDASLSYYEADTYNTPNQKYADVKNIIGLYSDIDVWNDKTYLFSDKIFKGNEGVAFTNSENVKTIYYDVDGQYGKQIQLTNKDGSKTATDYQARLKTVTATDGNNKEYSGLYIDDEVRTNANVKDIHEKTSIFITEDLDNEKIFNFRYASARSAGIRFCFVSPIKYDIAGPVKTSSVTKTTDNKNYIYSIIQKIPNNYYGYALKFANYSGTLYNSISISDIFDEKLTNIDKNKITIVNENDLDVTKYFDISLRSHL
ncbi:unknown [Clostridium sp. CAG:433]|nr:unknown [Clostridium sp. CAG:433]